MGGSAALGGVGVGFAGDLRWLSFVFSRHDTKEFGFRMSVGFYPLGFRWFSLESTQVMSYAVGVGKVYILHVEISPAYGACIPLIYKLDLVGYFDRGEKDKMVRFRLSYSCYLDAHGRMPW
jgi:hypothetical protein